MDGPWSTKLIDKYIVVNKKLGAGSFGVVYHAIMKDNFSHHLAAKTIQSKSLKNNKRFVECLTREIKILQTVSHPNIVKLHDVTRTDNYIYIFLECCNDGDLRSYMRSRPNKYLSEVDGVLFFKQIVQGFKALQQLKVMHRDIKPTNILLKNGQAKISDFGFARSMEIGMEEPSFYSRVGTPLYMSPQILEGLPFSSKCDVWSLGIMLFEMIYGYTPYDGDNPFAILKCIKSQPLRFPDKPIRSQVIKSLIRQMLEIQDKDRIPWDAIFDHQVVRLDPSLMQLNEKGLGNDLETSAQMNVLYNQSNLVQGYLQPIEANEFKEQFVNQEQPETASQDRQQQEDLQEEKILNQVEIGEKRRKTFAKFTTYFHFERNIGFMFNFVIQKFYKLMAEGAISISKQHYYLTLYCLSKNQNIHLFKLKSLLDDKHQERFDKDSWGKYLTSKDYGRVHSIISLDLKYTHNFLKSVIDKTIATTQEKDVQKQITMDLHQNSEFQTLYVQQINDVLKQLVLEVEDKKSAKLPYYREKLEVIYFFSICVNPYKEFTDVNQDFNLFYESISQATDKELAQKVNVQLKQL